MSQLDPIELEYLTKLLSRGKMLDQAKSQLEGAFASWSQHLQEKYELKPEDRIEEDGTITRAE